MTLQDRALSMLRSIAYQPRPLRHWTSGDYGISGNAVERYICDLLDRGYIQVTGKNGNRLYAITPKGERVLADRPQTATSRLHCNASMSEPYRPSWTPVRPGAEDHKRFKSFGGCV